MAASRAVSREPMVLLSDFLLPSVQLWTLTVTFLSLVPQANYLKVVDYAYLLNSILMTVK